MLLLKALARLLQALLMLALALVGLGVGLYCVSGLVSLGSARPDRLLHLPALRRHVGHYLHQLTYPGSTATLALAGGVVAVLIGLLLLVGLLGRRRERLLVIETDSELGGLYARPRTVSEMVGDEAARAPGVTAVRRPRVKLRRRGERGRVKVRAARGPDPDLDTVDDAVHARIDPITESLGLRPDIRVRLDEPEKAQVRGA